MSGRNAEEQDWIPREADEVQESPPNQGASHRPSAMHGTG